MIDESKSLSAIAREIFDESLQRVDPFEAVRRSVRLDEGEILRVADSVYNLKKNPFVYSVAIGKASAKMAKALDEILGERLKAGVLSAPKADLNLSKAWRIFTGGHPMPNKESFESARAAREILTDANKENSLVVFLISGGGSAMMELPRDERISLEDLQKASRVLVTCGATIAEINAIRRRLSAIKGGGLDSILENHVERVTLLISDTNQGDEKNIASGPTIQMIDSDVEEIIARYDLLSRFPLAVVRALNEIIDDKEQNPIPSPYYVLLSNEDALETAVNSAREKGFVVEKDMDFVEAEVETGCTRLVEKLLRLKEENNKPVCIVSGGEFVCRVRGRDGIGGRNLEAALRSAIHFSNAKDVNLAALHAGTDGIDGNSPAAGAIADETTIKRANSIGIDAKDFLESSDSYNFFKRLNDVIITEPTGTNVRDIRIFLAR